MYQNADSVRIGGSNYVERLGMPNYWTWIAFALAGVAIYRVASVLSRLNETLARIELKLEILMKRGS